MPSWNSILMLSGSVVRNQESSLTFLTQLNGVGLFPGRRVIYSPLYFVTFRTPPIFLEGEGRCISIAAHEMEDS